MKTQKYYYGIFREEAGAVTVSIPDVDICETFGATWDEAYENAIDALAGCLSVPETTVRPRTKKTELEAANPGAQIVPVPVDPRLVESYEEMKRINISISKNLLSEIDRFRANRGLKRSAFLAEAAKQMMEKETGRQ